MWIMPEREIGIKFLKNAKLLQHNEVSPGMIVESLPRSEIAIMSKDHFPKNCNTAFGYVMGRLEETIRALEFKYGDIVVGNLFPYRGSYQYGCGNMFDLLIDYAPKRKNAFLVVGRIINKPEEEIRGKYITNVHAETILDALEHDHIALMSYDAETLEKKLHHHALKKATKEYVFVTKNGKTHSLKDTLLTLREIKVNNNVGRTIK